jgi:hypothetical protein
MANTGQIARTPEWDVEESVMHNHELVREHIDDLLREGAILRAERLEAERRSSIASAIGHGSTPALAGARALRLARVRLGRWLVAFGWAVAGCHAESPVTGERARPAA